MAIIKDVTVKINNGTATLDAPVQFYEKDHDVELRFKLMDYKYKYDKDPQNILNSVDEDILEAYTTIVNPLGYELEQINGVVKNDTVIFRLDPTYTDELDEIGTYNLQIHIKCTCSEFTIPPISFEVLERLKGVKVVTDGEDEVDNSEILDNSSKFVSDETGKLIIEWKKGDMISSAKLNAMVDVINDAVDEEVIRQANEIKREQNVNNKIQQLENTRVEYVNKLETELDSFADQVDESMSDYETRFNALTASQQQDAEVIDARDGEQTLRARLDRDIQKPSIIYEEVEDSYITCDSTGGYAQNIEIKGNTIQDAVNLADIRSVGDKVEGQELYEIPVLSCGKNLIDAYTNLGEAMFITSNGNFLENSAWRYTKDYFKVAPNKEIVISETSSNYRQYQVSFYDVNYKWIQTIDIILGVISTITPQNAYYMRFSYSISVSGSSVERFGLQIEYGTQSTPYEPYQEDKLTILSPVQLEKVGDIADRIICKDGVWGIEKNIETVVFDGGEDWRTTSTLYKDGCQIYHLSGPEVESLNMRKSTDYPKNILSVSNRFVSEYRDNVILNNVPILSSEYTLAECISIKTSKLSENTVAGFKQWLKENPTIIKYITTQPQFILLPHDQQVKLRTFATKTNISFECEIEPTLKASVPKSIGATVNTNTEQISNLSKELDRVKKLEEGTASTVVTESDFTTVTETSNGYFEDVKLEGKTLVNLSTNVVYSVSVGGLSQEDYTITESDRYVKYTRTNTDATPTWLFAHGGAVPFDMIKPNTKYTIKLEKNIGILNVSLRSSTGDNIISNNGVFDENNLAVITTLDNIDKVEGNVQLIYFTVNDSSEVVELSNILFLEGDHTQNPPSYFEGLMSVGEDVEEVSVESIDGDGNLFNADYWELGFIGDSTGVYSQNDDYVRTKKIRVNPNTTYNFKGYSRRIYYYDIMGNFISRIDIGGGTFLEQSNSFTTPSNCHYIALRYDITHTNAVIKSLEEMKQYDTVIYKGDFREGLRFKVDKKPLLYYNPTTQVWEKPILRQWDSIEKHSDGKYYYHKRSGEVVLNGSENWVGNYSFTNTGRWSYIPSNVKEGSLLICDRFINKFNDDTGEESIFTKSFALLLTINNDKGNIVTWLQANPTTVVYQLAQEEVYECINIDLISYENETNFVVNTGAIVPKSTLKVLCNINNIVRELQQKVSNLENYIQHVMIDALNNALNE